MTRTILPIFLQRGASSVAPENVLAEAGLHCRYDALDRIKLSRTKNTDPRYGSRHA
jgi:hypothetical protein